MTEEEFRKKYKEGDWIMSKSTLTYIDYAYYILEIDSKRDEVLYYIYRDDEISTFPLRNFFNKDDLILCNQPINEGLDGMFIGNGCDIDTSGHMSGMPTESILTDYEELHRPPLGLMPRKIFIFQRNIDILAAMERYINNDKKIPIAWIQELRSNVENG